MAVESGQQTHSERQSRQLSLRCQRLRDNRLATPERCCLTYLPTGDWETGEIQRRVSQSELIEPLGIFVVLYLLKGNLSTFWTNVIINNTHMICWSKCFPMIRSGFNWFPFPSYSWAKPSSLITTIFTINYVYTLTRILTVCITISTWTLIDLKPFRFY